MTERLLVDESAPLLGFLVRSLAGWSRNTLKQRLQLGCVLVNDAVVTRHDHELRPGDAVEVRGRDEATARARPAAGIALLFVDPDLVAIDKPAGLLSVSTEQQRERTALALVRQSLSLPGKPAGLWPVHRLDRETSGVLLFARSREVCLALQSAWGQAAKTYLAVVEGHPTPPAGSIDEPLWEDANLRVHVGAHPDAKAARTHYTTRERGRARTLLEVELETGRRQQIRAHLAWLGHPIVGDDRHGVGGPRLGLHALRLRVAHPRDGRALVFEASPPPVLMALLHDN